MSIGQIIQGVSTGPSGTQSYRALEQTGRVLKQDDSPGVDRAAPKGEFMGLVQDFLGDVNHLQNRSGDSLKAFVAGEITDIHQVMVAGKEAAVALDLMIEIRNRVMEAYQEIMRIQV